MQYNTCHIGSLFFQLVSDIENSDVLKRITGPLLVFSFGGSCYATEVWLFQYLDLPRKVQVFLSMELSSRASMYVGFSLRTACLQGQRHLDLTAVSPLSARNRPPFMGILLYQKGGCRHLPPCWRLSVALTGKLS